MKRRRTVLSPRSFRRSVILLSLIAGDVFSFGPASLAFRADPPTLARGFRDVPARALGLRFGNRFPDPEEKKSADSPSPSGLIGRIWLEFRRR